MTLSREDGNLWSQIVILEMYSNIKIAEIFRDQAEREYLQQTSCKTHEGPNVRIKIQ